MARNVDAVVKPTDILTATNGQIPRELMVTVGGTTFLGHRLFTRAWNAMTTGCAAATSVNLRMTGVYRSYEAQRNLFLNRYRDTGTNSLAAARLHAGTRQLKFWSKARGGTDTYWMKVVGATAAVPGTSNHGWGLAVDIHTGDLTTGVLGWLEAHAQSYGMSWEPGIQNSEPWHLRYFPGDAVPQAVLVYEEGQHPGPGVPIPPPNLPAGMEPWMKDYLVWFSNTVAYPSNTKPNIKNPQKTPKEIIQYAQIVMRFVAGQSIVIDGDFGSRSEAACRNVQAWFKLTVDGQVGPKETWPVLDWIAVDFKNKQGW